jgi:hypothetical protein
MSLPTAADIGTLKYVDSGQVFGSYQESSADTTTMKFVCMGQPFYAQGAGVPGVASPIPVIIVCT